MNERTTQSRIWITLLACVAGLLVGAPRTRAEPKLADEDRLVAQMVSQILQIGHLSRPKIDQEISGRLFTRFLKDVDSNKLYFLQSDINEFKKSQSTLGSTLAEGNLSFPYKVYERFSRRLAERQKLIEELVAAEHDFTVKETMPIDADGIAFATDETELRERWRKRIKFDLLMQRLGDKPVGAAEAKQKVLERYQELAKRWKQVDNADLLELYLTSLATSIDPHSTYMSPATMDDFAIAIRLNLDGIGAVLRSENGHTIVVEVVPGGAAAKGGQLKPNDKIVGVAQGDGKFTDVVGMKLRQVVKLIRGERGTRVQLKVLPDGKLQSVVYDFTRQKVELKSQEARGEIVEVGKKADGSPHRFGVIDLPSFYADEEKGKAAIKSATEDVRKLLKDFEGKRVDGVILDLRRNGGGLLTEALALTGLFIDQGPIVQVKGGRGGLQVKEDPEKGIVYDGPMMVLVSRFSASASEILAGALQDYGRALVVGDSATHGKGSVQAIIDLSSQLRVADPPKLGALKLTIQQFYRVNGASTQVKGVNSDVVVPSLTEHVATSEKDLDHAMAFDKVREVEHDRLNRLTETARTILRQRSVDRVKASTEFAKLSKEVETLKARKARKIVSLNEQELRDQLAKDKEDKLDERVKELLRTSENGNSGATEYKFKRNFVNNEILEIMEDLVEIKKLARTP